VAPLQSLFQDLFPKAARIYQTTLPLGVGTPSVATQFSTVSIMVRTVDSVVFDKQNPSEPYFNDFTKTIDGLSFDKNAYADSCSAIRRTLSLAGFTSSDDEAYALAHIAIKNNLSRAAVAGCLGDMCPSAIAAKMDDVDLWKGNLDLKPATGDCQGISSTPTPVQPPYLPVIYNAVKDLSQYYGQYTADSPMPAGLQQISSKEFSSSVEIDDRMSYTLFGTTQAIDPPGLIKFLKTKSFLLLGCYSPTSDPRMFYGSSASIVSAKIDKPGATAPIDSAIALFPLWNGPTIGKMVVSDDRQDITASIGQSTSCGRFTVSK
jgi:hypothetical protein